MFCIVSVYIVVFNQYCCEKLPSPNKAAQKLADDRGLHLTMDGPPVKRTWSTHQRWVLQLASRIGNHANHHYMRNTCGLSNFTNQISGVSTGDLWLVIWEIIWNSQKDGFCMSGSVGFLHLLFFHVFPFFHFHLSVCPKSQGKPKRNKKNNPVRRFWSKSIPDCLFFVFLVFLVFFEVFWCPKPQPSKNSRKTQKNKKPILWEESWVSPFRIVFFCFFLVYLVFLEVFAVPSPTVQKLEENQKKQKKQSCEKNLG